MNCREKKLKKNFLLKNPGGGVEVLGVKIKKVLEISWTAEKLINFFNPPPRWEGPERSGVTS